MFDRILLQPEQEELLVRMVDAARSVPSEEREKFLLAETNGGDFLMHRGLPQTQSRVVAEDVETLASEGLLAVKYGSRGTPNYNITPLGYRYYEHLTLQGADPAEQVEREVKKLIESHDFAERYPEATQRWMSAAEALWSADSDKAATAIGHHCRDAVQAFASTLVEEFQPAGVPSDSAKDVARIRGVLNAVSEQLGGSEAKLLEALLGYWGAITDLVQRQEHGGQREGNQLSWEDSRRVVFQTAVLFYEFDRTLHRLRPKPT